MSAQSKVVDIAGKFGGRDDGGKMTPLMVFAVAIALQESVDVAMLAMHIKVFSEKTAASDRSELLLLAEMMEKVGEMAAKSRGRDFSPMPYKGPPTP